MLPFRRNIKKIRFRHSYEHRPLPIVRHAAATMPEAMGKLVPVLIVDTSERPDVEDYVRIHEAYGTGDVRTQWGRKPENSNIYQLILEVIRPVELNIYFEFNFPEAISTIDHIVHSQSLCIQPGRPGDTLIETYARARRVVMEVPETGFGPKWNARLHRHFERQFKREGLSKKAAEKTAKDFIETRRQLFDLQLPAPFSGE